MSNKCFNIFFLNFFTCIIKKLAKWWFADAKKISIFYKGLNIFLKPILHLIVDNISKKISFFLSIHFQKIFSDAFMVNIILDEILIFQFQFWKYL